MAEGKASKKGKSYDRGEEVQLCRSYVNVGEDPRVGTGQKAKQFWQRVGAHFHDNLGKQGTSRPNRSLESKWAEIRTDVTRFIGAYAHVEACNESGVTEEDILQKSHELYKLKHPRNQDFRFVHCWEILRTVSKWMTYREQVQEPSKSMKRKIDIPSSGDNKSISSVIDDEEGAAGFDVMPVNVCSGTPRPQGSKSAKRKSAEQVMSDSGHKLQAKAAEKMANANFERNEMLRNQATLQLFSIPNEVGQSNEFRQYLALRREEEMYALKARIIAARKRDRELNSSDLDIFDVQTPDRDIPDRTTIQDSQHDHVCVNTNGGFSDMLNTDSPDNTEQNGMRTQNGVMSLM